MSGTWPRTRLGDVLRQLVRPIDVQAETEYQEIGIRSFGNGIFHKERLPGLLIGEKRVFAIEPGDFVLNIVFAWEGALAIASEGERGLIGSHRFPTFRADETRLDPRFLLWFLLTREGLKMLLRVSPGGAGRNRTLSRDAFLDLHVPVPPLTAQKLVADRLDAVRTQVGAAVATMHVASAAAEKLAQAVIAEQWSRENRWPRSRFDSVVRLVSGQVDPRVEPYASMPHVNGEAIETGTGRLLGYRTAAQDGVISGKYAFSAGSVLYSKIRPYLRKATVVPEVGICSADVYATEWIAPPLLPLFLVYTLLSPRFTAYANRLSGRTRMPKLNQGQLLAFELGIPPLPEQKQIIARVGVAVTQQTKLEALMAERAVAFKAITTSALGALFEAS